MTIISSCAVDLKKRSQRKIRSAILPLAVDEDVGDGKDDGEGNPSRLPLPN